MFDEIKEVIVTQLNVDPDVITPETNLFKDLNIDSLDAVEVVLALEDKYGCEIENEAAEQFETVQDILDYFGGKTL